MSVFDTVVNDISNFSGANSAGNNATTNALSLFNPLVTPTENSVTSALGLPSTASYNNGLNNGASFNNNTSGSASYMSGWSQIFVNIVIIIIGFEIVMASLHKPGIVSVVSNVIRKG